MAKKLVLTLPDWAEERHIYVMAGMELLAYWPYPHDKPLMKKTVRCNWCGWCCENLAERAGFEVDENGVCIHLDLVGGQKECSLAGSRPWKCCFSDPILTKLLNAEEVCCIRYGK